MNTSPGGGFDSNSSPATDSPTKKGRSGAAQQSLTPVTIKQLYEATQQHPDDVFKVGQRELHQVTLVANVLSVTEQTSNVSFSVDDGTGKIDARLWVDKDDQSDYTMARKGTWKEGIYVRVVGQLRTFGGKRSVVAFRIAPLTDYNEVTHHLLEVVYVHLLNTKGLQQGALQSNFGNNNQSFGNNNNAFSTYNNNSSNSNPYMMQSSTHNNSNNMNFSSMSELNGAVLNTIRNSQGAHQGQGVSVMFVAQQLGRNEPEIRAAIEFLTTEGHLYSTVDEDHYNTTDQS